MALVNFFSVQAKWLTTGRWACGRLQ